LEKGGKEETRNNSFSICSPTTKRELKSMNAQLEKDKICLIGIQYPKLNNIYPNKDGKYRKLSNYLSDPEYLILIYNKLKSSGLINDRLELE
jgi:hypothetical protein